MKTKGLKKFLKRQIQQLYEDRRDSQDHYQIVAIDEHIQELEDALEELDARTD